MKAYELKLASLLLSQAADEFSHHGCNDFNLKEAGLQDFEIVELLQNYCLHNHRGNEEAAAADYFEMTSGSARRYALMDTSIMSYLAHKLKTVSYIEVRQLCNTTCYELDTKKSVETVPHSTTEAALQSAVTDSQLHNVTWEYTQ